MMTRTGQRPGRLRLTGWIAFAALLAALPLRGQQNDSSGSMILEIGGGGENGDATVNFGSQSGYGGFNVGAVTGSDAHLQLSNSKILGGDFGGALRLNVSQANATFVNNLPPAMIATQNGLTEMQVEQRLTFIMQSYQLEFLAEYRPWGVFTIAAGPYLGYRRLYNVRNVHNLLSPANVRFTNPTQLPTENDGRTLVVDDGSLLSSQPFTLGGLLAASYPLALGEGFSLVSELRLRYDALAPAGGTQWNMWSYGGGLSFSYRLSSGEPLDTKLQSDHPSLPSPLVASVDLYSSAADGSRIQEAIVQTGTITHRRDLSLPPVILFDPGATVPPGKYVRLSPESRSRFSPDSVARLDPAAACYQLLNIVGSNLRANPRARVRLTGSASSDEVAGTGRSRAEWVRTYLVTVWGCSPSQFEIAREIRREGGEAILRSVRLDTDPEISTLSGGWSERTLKSTPIGVEPEIVAPAGVKRWTITFSHNGTVLSRMTSDRARSRQVNFDMLLGDIGSSDNPSPLVADLSIEDSAGATASGHDELRFRMERESPDNNGRAVLSYFLAGNPSTDRKQLFQIVGLITGGATVTVAGRGASPAPAEKIAADLRSMLASAGKEDIRVEVKSESGASQGSARVAVESLLANGVEISISFPATTGAATRP